MAVVIVVVVAVTRMKFRIYRPHTPKLCGVMECSNLTTIVENPFAEARGLPVAEREGRSPVP